MSDIRGQVTESAECEICGKAVTYSYNPSESMWSGVDTQSRAMEYHFENFHPVVIQRDGARGVYLVPLFWEDVFDLIEKPLPDEVASAIKIYNASSVLSDEPMPTDEALQNASDILFDYNEPEGLLSDAGYSVEHEDGYVIRQVAPTKVERSKTCRHCGRSIVQIDGAWIDTNASGDDAIWRETCDGNDTFTALHEPEGTGSK